MTLLRPAVAAAGLWLLAAGSSTLPAFALQEPALLTVDARRQPAAPEAGHLRMGTATTPDGRTLEVNSRYLTLDGEPWLPVAGEMHYPRVPNRYWREELAKMKAAGVDIVTTYVFWNFHEKVPGRFDWTGDRDLRRFVTLCDELGLKVLLRPGPWVHSEARFGGLPDWVVNAMPTRRSDPQYLHYVTRYFDQVARQVEGLLWKDGGPVLGVQLENEYGHVGDTGGPGHLLDLKRIAREAGLDVPLYTITGWGGSGLPEGEVVPMGGGYPDVPWGLSPEMSPPSGVYAFRYRRWAPAAAADPAGPASDEGPVPSTPYFGAEFGGGVPPMYRRRPILVPADVAAMLPVNLGSGVNLYGYYMFHGGQNSPDHDAMNETTAIGAYNDVPQIDYDFQAPLGAYGQEHAVMGTVRPVHYFLNTFGSDLAPMVVHPPDKVASGPRDLETPRFSVRSLGNSGFLFLNNHVRQHPMAAHEDVRFAVSLPGGTVTFPSTPIDIPSGAYFIWPFGMELSGARLAWATAQPITRIETDGTPVYVFFAQPGIPAELAFEAAGVAGVTAATGTVRRNPAGRYLVTGMEPGSGAVVTVTLSSGGTVRVLLLTQAQAEALTLPVLDGAPRLLITDAQVFQDGGRLTMLSTGDPAFRFSVFPRLSRSPSGSLPMTTAGQDGVFQVFEAGATPRELSVSVAKIRDAEPVPPLVLGPPGNTPHMPAPEVFGRSAAWSIEVHGEVAADRDAFLRISARGDVARLFSGVTMLDDQFLSGAVWEIGLRYIQDALDEPLTLTVLPMRSDAPIYLEDGVDDMVTGDQTAEVSAVEVVPRYRLELEWTEPGPGGT